MAVPCRPLVEVIAQVPDWRQRRGQRHALGAVLALACAALLAGARSYRAMADWGRHYGQPLTTATQAKCCSAILVRTEIMLL